MVPSTTSYPPNHTMTVTEIAARNSTDGVKRLVSCTFFIAAWKLSSFCLQKRLIS